MDRQKMFNDKDFSVRRYKQFFKKVLETYEVFFFYKPLSQAIYGTESNEFVDENNQPKSVIPFWSNTAYPRNWLYDYEENDLQISSVTLEEFVSILQDMSKNDGIVGIEWNAQGIGIELPANQILQDLLEALKS
jgi:hypothetical protein